MKPIKLYGIPASNASLTAQRALERKGLPYRRLDLIPIQHRITMRMLGFPGSTVPGIVVDGRRVHGTRAIMRALDELRPDPALYPREPEKRRRVEEAELWGERVWQKMFRYLLPYALLRRYDALPTLFADERMRVPAGVIVRTGKGGVLVNSRLNRSSEENVRRELAALPERLNRIEGLIADGVLSLDEPRAADLMIAPTTRGLLWYEDLRPAIEGRPAGEHARRLVPRFPGAIPPVFPPEAVEPLHAARRS